MSSVNELGAHAYPGAASCRLALITPSSPAIDMASQKQQEACSGD